MAVGEVANRMLERRARMQHATEHCGVCAERCRQCEQACQALLRGMR